MWVFYLFYFFFLGCAAHVCVLSFFNTLSISWSGGHFLEQYIDVDRLLFYVEPLWNVHQCYWCGNWQCGGHATHFNITIMCCVLLNVESLQTCKWFCVLESLVQIIFAHVCIYFCYFKPSSYLKTGDSGLRDFSCMILNGCWAYARTQYDFNLPFTHSILSPWSISSLATSVVKSPIALT